MSATASATSPASMRATPRTSARYPRLVRQRRSRAGAVWQWRQGRETRSARAGKRAGRPGGLLRAGLPASPDPVTTSALAQGPALRAMKPLAAPLAGLRPARTPHFRSCRGRASHSRAIPAAVGFALRAHPPLASAFGLGCARGSRRPMKPADSGRRLRLPNAGRRAGARPGRRKSAPMKRARFGRRCRPFGAHRRRGSRNSARRIPAGDVTQKARAIPHFVAPVLAAGGSSREPQDQEPEQKQDQQRNAASPREGQCPFFADWCIPAESESRGSRCARRRARWARGGTYGARLQKAERACGAESKNATSDAGRVLHLWGKRRVRRALSEVRSP